MREIIGCEITGQPEFNLSNVDDAKPKSKGRREVQQDLLDGDGDSDSTADHLYADAVAFVRKEQRASISQVQRHFKIGYNRAARLVEQMEFEGIVSAMKSNGSRTILN